MQRTLLVAIGLSLAAMTVLISCARKSAPNASSTVSAQVTVPGPPCIIYKTKGDFSRLIPVEMTADKTKLASFSDVADIYREGELAYPTQLVDGYLLDNRGIGPNVAFLKLTYDDYRKLDGTPAASELIDAIIEPDPLLEMYQCGNRSQYKDAVSELNELIRSGKLTGCRKIK
jgi:hypothetical protein